MNEQGKGLKDVELRLISEVLKNSCRSDRELAKAMGVSQPTVSRTKAKLQKEGYISEYTVIPNFNKLGYHVFALTFFTWKKGFSGVEKEKAIKWALAKAPSAPNNIILIERGMGLGYDSLMASFHENYSSYVKLLDNVRTSPYVDLSNMDSFIVNLDDKIHYRYLTFSTLAKHLSEREEKLSES
jgi:DNA-binding Lrp family transcriptional regulator